MADSCKQCGQPATSALCRKCSSNLEACDGILPEHLLSTASADTAHAWLVDPWGRGHAVLPDTTIIGRSDADIAAYHHSVSRQHARIDGGERGWTVRDLGSKNGTFVDGARIARAPLSDGAMVRIGALPLCFRTRESKEAIPHRVSVSTTDIDRGGFRCVLRPTRDAARRVVLTRVAVDAAGVAIGYDIGRAAVEVSVPALEFGLLQLLVERLWAGKDFDSAIGQCVTTRELVARLPFRSAHPTEDNVRQSVRRLRKTLAKAGVEDIVEAVPPHGYRLCWVLD